ncbi:MAG: hypothetical protein FMNOHCHN_03843 [Ignavibacteriaceae bacterium]|nr:hypothetical protein [Ignavibacteriaceae bacterium]
MSNLPAKYKRYVLSLSNKEFFNLTGLEIEEIMGSEEQLIWVARIDAIINKAHIVSVSLDSKKTHEVFESLPKSEQIKILEETGDTLRVSALKYLEGRVEK